MIDDELHTADSEDLNDWLVEVEKSFNFQFAENELTDVQTFGDLSARVTNKFILAQSDDCTSQQAFYQIRTAMMNIWGVKSVTPRTQLADILPRKNRVHNVKKLEQDMNIKLHLLAPPAFVVNTLLILTLVSLAGFFVSFLVGILALSLSISGFWVANHFGKELEVKTVGELTKLVTRKNSIWSRRDAQTFNRNEIENLLADWLCEDFYLSRTKLTKESKFDWAT